MTFPQILQERTAQALASAGVALPPGFIPDVVPAADTRFGDYQTNAAMVLARQVKQNPRALAQSVADRIDVSGISAAPEIAGPGFINFRILPEALAARLGSMLESDRLGMQPAAEPRTFVIDFSSPNVAKSMHVGHIRSTILGDSLARTARFLGHRVITDNHIGDWGTQFGMLLLGWKTILDQAALEREPIAELERVYKAVNAACGNDPAEREKAKAELVKLQDGDAENLAIWKQMIALSQVQFDRIYSRLGITFDHTLGESFYNPWLKEVVDELLEKGIARDSEGAVAIFSDGSVSPADDPFLIKDEEWRDAPALVRKADGAANYATTDLVTLRHRIKEWQPDEILYVTDGRQQLHFRQIFSAFSRWYPDSKVKLAHVWFGSILGEDGKPFRSRDGETVKLAGLLDEAEARAYDIVKDKNPDMPEDERREIARRIGIGSIKYADLLPNRQVDYVFSWDRMLALNGNTMPYMANAYVRTRSIFRKLEGAVPDLTGPHQLTEPNEISLALLLARFGESVTQVMSDYRPNLLENYLFEVARAFHSFFESCHVLRSEGQVRITRLALCELTGRVLQKGMDLLGIELPERM